MEQALADILSDVRFKTSATAAAAVACLPVFARGKLSTTYNMTMDQCTALVRTAVERDYDHEYCISITGLPFTKLYFDIDCLECKNAQRQGDGRRCTAAAAAAASVAAPIKTAEHAVQCASVFANLQAELARCLSIDADVVAEAMPRHIMVREDQPYCGFHVVYDVLIDFVARDHLIMRMAGVKLSDRHAIDWPENLLLPYGRKYKHLLSWDTAATTSGAIDKDCLPQVIPITCDTVDALLPVRCMRVPNELHISVSLAPVGYDLQLIRAGDVVDTMYVARDSLEYTPKSLYSRICSQLRRRPFDVFDYVRYEKPCFALDTTAHVVPRELMESFLDSRSALSSYQAVPYSGSTCCVDDTDDDEQYHLQEMELYEQRVRVSSRPSSTLLERNETRAIADNTASPFYPFLGEQLAFYDEAVNDDRRRPFKDETTFHETWISHIAEDTIQLLDRCLRIPCEKYFSTDEGNGDRGGRDCNFRGDGSGSGSDNNYNNDGDNVDKKSGGDGEEASANRGMKRKRKISENCARSSHEFSSSRGSNRGASSSVDRVSLAKRMLDNAVRRCGAYTSVVSTLMRYGKMNRTDACKYLIARYPDVRAGVFVWTRLGITPDFDVFLKNNYSRTDMVYLMLKTHLRNETATQRLYELVRKVITDASTVANVFARDVYIMKATGSTLSYFNGQKIVMKRKTQMRKLLALVDDVEFESIHVEIKCSYSYRTNCGIFNPVTGVFESNGPSLNEFVYRQFTASLMEQSSLLYFKPALFKFALDCYLKVPAYIRHVEATVPVIVLVSPLWPVYNQYPNFKRYQSMPIRNFAIADFQTLLADLNRTLHYPWPEDLCDRVESMISSNTELGMLILNCLGALYTLAQYVTIDPLDVAHIVVSLFGQAPHSYIGIPEWKTDDEYNVIIKSSSSLSSKRQQSGGSGSGGVNEDGDSHSLIIMRQMNETLVKETDRLPMATSLTFRSLNVQTSVAMTALFRKIGFQGLDQDVDVDVVVETMITKDHDNNNSKSNTNPTTSVRMDLSRYEYVKCAILLAAWFTRMGERHVLNDSPLFVYVNAKRPTLYAQLVEFANGLGNVTVVNNQCELTDHFLSFLENTEYDARDTIQYPATFDVGHLLRSHAASASNAQLIGDVSALVDHSPAPTAGEKRKLASAVVHLLRSGSFQYDYFVELCKIIAYLEYLGNPLQLGYNFYGSSSSGKSFFTELLDRVFATGSNTILSLRTFHKSKPTENDIVQLGTNFLVRVNGDDEHLDVKAFKKYVDFNYVTRDHIQKNLNIKYAIRAKTFFISNRCVHVNKPFDSGFCNRYYPIMFDFDFVYVHEHLDRLINHSSALNMYTTKYLGGQILMQRYPAGSMSSLDTEIAVLSRQFLTRFFFFNMVHPISPKKTGLVERLHSRYLDVTNPIQYFYKTVEIIPTNRGIDESRVREILLIWWKKHKDNFARIKDFGYIMNIIVNYLDRYRVGKMYNLEFVMLK